MGKDPIDAIHHGWQDLFSKLIQAVASLSEKPRARLLGWLIGGLIVIVVGGIVARAVVDWPRGNVTASHGGVAAGGDISGNVSTTGGQTSSAPSRNLATQRP